MFHVKNASFIPFSEVCDAIRDEKFADEIRETVSNSDFAFGTNNRTLIALLDFVDVVQTPMTTEQIESEKWLSIRKALTEIDVVIRAKDPNGLYIDLEN